MTKMNRQVQIGFRLDPVVYRRLEDICSRTGTTIPKALNMLLVGAVQRGNFDWRPWDESITDNGYMPYELIKRRLQLREREREYAARRREARRSAKKQQLASD